MHGKNNPRYINGSRINGRIILKYCKECEIEYNSIGSGNKHQHGKNHNHYKTQKGREKNNKQKQKRIWLRRQDIKIYMIKRNKYRELQRNYKEIVPNWEI